MRQGSIEKKGYFQCRTLGEIACLLLCTKFSRGRIRTQSPVIVILLGVLYQSINMSLIGFVLRKSFIVGGGFGLM